MGSAVIYRQEIIQDITLLHQSRKQGFIPSCFHIWIYPISRIMLQKQGVKALLAVAYAGFHH